MERIVLADRMHWTLDYVEGLDSERYAQVLTVIDAIDRAREFKLKRRG